MSNADWIKLDFKNFISQKGIEPVVQSAPKILYSKKDKEHEAFNSLIISIFLASFLFIYLAITIALSSIWFSWPILIVVLIVVIVAEIILLLNYQKSNIYIRPIECWVDIYKNKTEKSFDYYCFVYYPVFSGKCHPNIAKNVIYKLYQEEILKNTIDISQIEIYLKIEKDYSKKLEYLGFFFQYGEGKSFLDEDINYNSWRYFPHKKSLKDNFIAIANWYHQYEWRNDLILDFDKLHEYAPWVIKIWNTMNLKPLTEEYKEKINWNLRNIDSIPKLKPWADDLEKQVYENKDASKDLESIEEAIKHVKGKEVFVESLKDIEKELFKFKAYFRDISS